MELLGGHATDAPQALDRQRMQEVELAIRRHEEEPVRLGDRTRDLGEELRARDPDRDRQPDPLAHGTPEEIAVKLRRAGDAAQPADVEERLVDREALDERRGVAEDREDGLARRRVGVHPRRHNDGLGAERPRLPPVHRGAHAAPLRLVAAREHDAAADDHGPPAQVRCVALLDRGVERVEIGVQDGGLAVHEQMFASSTDRTEADAAARQNCRWPGLALPP